MFNCVCQIFNVTKDNGCKGLVKNYELCVLNVE